MQGTTSLSCLPVQTNGADDFNLVFIHISNELNGLDARIVHTQHDEIIVDQHWEGAGAGSPGWIDMAIGVSIRALWRG